MSLFKSTKFRIAVLAMCAVLLFTGLGFSAWVFTNSKTVQDVTITDSVRCAVELNDGFKAYKNSDGTGEITDLYLICDAPTSPAAGLMAGNGIYWSTTNDGANKIEKIYIAGTLNFNKEDYKDITSVTVRFTLSTGEGYLAAVDGTYVDATAMTASTTKDIAIPDDTNTEVKVISDAIALPTVSYDNAHVPTNVAGVTALNTEVTDTFNGKKIGFTAEITAKA